MKLILLVAALLSLSLNAVAKSFEVEADEIFKVLPTGSMKPAFDEDSLLYVKKISFDKVRRGDVVLAQFDKTEGWPDDPVCHRVVDILINGWLVVKGDNRPDTELVLVNEEMYVGTVVAIVRRD